MLTAAVAAARHRRANIIAAFLGQMDDALRVAETTFYPFLDLAIRLWLAQLFWVSGILKLADWDTALRLATYEYPVTWLDPATAATLGIAIEVIGPVLLAFGLATRLAAIPLLILTLVTQFEYQALDQHLYQAALFGWYLIMGADNIQTIDRFYQCLLLGLIALHGPGLIAADAALKWQLARWFPPLQSWSDAALTDAPHVVIVGAGFGGLKAAHGLRQAACRITVIDKRNYHLFQPLLYQVATASLSPADIATPIRAMFRDQHNIRVVLGEVMDVDTAVRQVILNDGSRISYDYLVLATGARHSYFGRDDWEPYAPGLKQIEDATAIRRRLLLAFEQAENCADPEERQKLLTFVIVGGGPTGVELAGAIAELSQHGLAGEFRDIDPTQARVLLVQSAPRLLPTFPETLSAVAAQSLQALGVEVLTKSRVEQIDDDGVRVSGQRIGSRTVFWAAGVMASSAAQWIKGEADSAGRLKVGADLSAAGLPNVFAVGDTALSAAWNGQPTPGLAPAAKQQGAYVAHVIKARLEGQPELPPFRYRHMGNLATIGRQSAVVDFGPIRLSGALAWWLWGVAHLLFLVDTRKRLSVAIEWFWAYLTFKRGTRLITGGHE
ncbi:FAD-dependent oxidoreductase [Candidatus Contendibacter odensensis]|uniref:NADH:ubiquinone reductase (non-electrogenic) n=1 Tax=Candidatus Contendobacter odensis Run_B_J11 TaxID=1400861 RepID=A0A7U7J3Z0_9GAMM